MGISNSDSMDSVIFFPSAEPFKADVAPLIKTPMENGFNNKFILPSSIFCIERTSFSVSLMKFVAPFIVSTASLDSLLNLL